MVDGTPSRAGDERLPSVRIVRVGAQVDPGIQAQERTDGWFFKPRQQNGDDGKVRAARLTIESERDLPLLPVADPRRAAQHQHTPRGGYLCLELRLPRLSGRQAVTVKKAREADVGEAEPDPFCPRRIRTTVTEEDAGAHAGDTGAQAGAAAAAGAGRAAASSPVRID